MNMTLKITMKEGERITVEKVFQAEIIKLESAKDQLFFIHRTQNGWKVTEYLTGSLLYDGWLMTKEDTIKQANKYYQKVKNEFDARQTYTLLRIASQGIKIPVNK